MAFKSHSTKPTHNFSHINIVYVKEFARRNATVIGCSNVRQLSNGILKCAKQTVIVPPNFNKHAIVKNIDV